MNCSNHPRPYLLIFIIPFVFSFGQEEEESQDGAGGDAGGDTGELPQKPVRFASQPTAASGATEESFGCSRPLGCGFRLRRLTLG